MRIIEEIDRIVVMNKTIITDGKIHSQRGQDQEKTNKSRLAKRMK
jgi:hypothetical protein